PGLDPRMSVTALDDVVLAHGIERAASKADDHPGRDALAAEHQHQGAGKILAMPRAMVGDEIFDRIQLPVAIEVEVERKLVKIRSVKVPLQGQDLVERFSLGQFLLREHLS